MAEWSKAPDLSSGTRKCAWVRTPLLTSFLFWYTIQRLKFTIYSGQDFFLCMTSKRRLIAQKNSQVNLFMHNQKLFLILDQWRRETMHGDSIMTYPKPTSHPWCIGVWSNFVDWRPDSKKVDACDKSGQCSIKYQTPQKPFPSRSWHNTNSHLNRSSLFESEAFF